MSRVFKNKLRSTGFYKNAIGTATFTVKLDFLPDFMTAYFSTQGHRKTPTHYVPNAQHDGKASKQDNISWELVKNDDKYDFIIYYNSVHYRDIQWVAAKLPIEVIK